MSGDLIPPVKVVSAEVMEPCLGCGHWKEEHRSPGRCRESINLNNCDDFIMLDEQSTDPRKWGQSVTLCICAGYQGKP